MNRSILRAGFLVFFALSLPVIVGLTIHAASAASEDCGERTTPPARTSEEALRLKAPQEPKRIIFEFPSRGAWGPTSALNCRTPRRSLRRTSRLTSSSARHDSYTRRPSRTSRRRFWSPVPPIQRPIAAVNIEICRVPEWIGHVRGGDVRRLGQDHRRSVQNGPDSTADRYQGHRVGLDLPFGRPRRPRRRLVGWYSNSRGLMARWSEDGRGEGSGDESPSSRDSARCRAGSTRRRPYRGRLFRGSIISMRHRSKLRGRQGAILAS